MNKYESFLDHKNIFITGATGFLGKSIIETLLRYNIGKIFCLVRKPKDGDTKSKLFRIFENKIFNKLRIQIGETSFNQMIAKKIYAIEGDIGLENLGTKTQDYEFLKLGLDCVVHCAATVNFNEKLDMSLNLNTLGTMRVLDLCENSKKIKSFIHVSTAYVNSNILNTKENIIEEKVYPMRLGDTLELIKRIKRMSSTEIKNFTKLVLSEYPNTYTFTKSLAENMSLKRATKMNNLNYDGNKFFINIIRPSIVTSALNQPIPGWLDGVSAANGISLYIGMGIINKIPIDTQNNNTMEDMVPVDFVSSIVLNALYYNHLKVEPPKNFKLPYYQLSESYSTDAMDFYPYIFHACTTSINPLKTLDYYQKLTKKWQNFPRLKKQVFKVNLDMVDFRDYKNLTEIESQYKYQTLSTGSLEINKTSSYSSKLDTLYSLFEYFIVNSWTFETTNTKKLFSYNPIKGTSLINLCNYNDIQIMNWDYYIELFIYGLYYYVLNENPKYRFKSFRSSNMAVLEPKFDNLSMIDYSLLSDIKITNKMFVDNLNIKDLRPDFLDVLNNRINNTINFNLKTLKSRETIFKEVFNDIGFNGKTLYSNDLNIDTFSKQNIFVIRKSYSKVVDFYKNYYAYYFLLSMKKDTVYFFYDKEVYTLSIKNGTLTTSKLFKNLVDENNMYEVNQKHLQMLTKHGYNILFFDKKESLPDQAQQHIVEINISFEYLMFDRKNKGYNNCIKRPGGKTYVSINSQVILSPISLISLILLANTNAIKISDIKQLFITTTMMLKTCYKEKIVLDYCCHREDINSILYYSLHYIGEEHFILNEHTIKLNQNYKTISYLKNVVGKDIMDLFLRIGIDKICYCLDDSPTLNSKNYRFYSKLLLCAKQDNVNQFNKETMNKKLSKLETVLIRYNLESKSRSLILCLVILKWMITEKVTKINIKSLTQIINNLNIDEFYHNYLCETDLLYSLETLKLFDLIDFTDIQSIVTKNSSSNRSLNLDLISMMMENVKICIIISANNYCKNNKKSLKNLVNEKNSFIEKDISQIETQLYYKHPKVN